ncbi:hypothetical protein B2J88_07915 [Rhodococcus sp. SRB_17]|nr:hypothetical protein [Rhodococcus sp. SRB_17]
MQREASLREPVQHPLIGTYSALTEVAIVHKDAHGYTICLDNGHPRAAGRCHTVLVQRHQLYIPHERKAAA